MNKNKIKRVLSIDYGTKKFGFAISDEDLNLALKLKVKEFQNLDEIYRYIKEIVESEKTNLIVIGYPLNSNFEKTPLCEKIDEFIINLQDQLKDITIIKVNEVLTSKSAKINLKTHGVKSKYVDSEAARLILQDFLDNL